MHTLAAPPITDLRFLIVEDDDFQRRWLAVMLAKLGATQVVETRDGLAALEILGDPAQSIDVSLIDLDMPEMDGLELIRHLARAEHRTSVILTSALGSALLLSAETMSNAYGVNLLGAFEKPATPELLRELIGKCRPRPGGEQGVAPEAAFGLEEIRQGLLDGQFEPFFQPQVELATGKVKGVEAFARWHHPRHGLLAPAAFIPVLETGNAMEALTWAMAEKAATWCRDWQACGWNLPVSINLSASSLAQPQFAEKILALTGRHGLDSSYVGFEISEAMAMTELPVCLENLARLRLKGFGLAVDDFGTGHSSLQQLLRIPFLDLKVDRSFVVGAARNAALGIALSSSLELARKLQRNSVAVGVETREDWDLLRRLGCTYAQGYYIAKPMEAGAIPGWIEEWSHFF